MSLFEDVNAGIKAAMKARDKQRLEALKGIKADTVLCPCPECVRNAVLALGAG